MSRTVTRSVVVKTGRFDCPVCTRQTGFEHRAVKRYRKVLRVLKVPQGLVGEHVECDECDTTFHPSVLQGDTDARGSELCKAIRRVMVMMSVADGHLDPTEVQAMNRIAVDLTGIPFPEDEVNAVLKTVHTEGLPLNPWLRSLMGSLNKSGRKAVLMAAAGIAAADDKLEVAEVALLNRIAERLELGKKSVDHTLAQYATP